MPKSTRRAARMTNAKAVCAQRTVLRAAGTGGRGSPAGRPYNDGSPCNEPQARSYPTAPTRGRSKEWGIELQLQTEPQYRPRMAAARRSGSDWTPARPFVAEGR